MSREKKKDCLNCLHYAMMEEEKIKKCLLTRIRKRFGGYLFCTD